MKKSHIGKGMSLIAAFVLSTPALSADLSSVEVKQILPNGETQAVQYEMLTKAQKPWKICAALPHLKDPFWMATNYGMTEEAKRIGVELQVLDAGGYPNLNNQISQIENCVTGGAQAVVAAATSRDGLNNLFSELKKKGIPTVDLLIGVSSTDVDSKVLASPYAEGLNAGQYLVRLHPEGTPTVKVAWLPGPAGTGFVEQFEAGFQEGIKGGAIEIVETKHGDLGKEIQARLIEDVLQTHRQLDYIVGSGVTAEAGVPILRAHNRQKDVKLVALYMTPGVYEAMKQNAVTAAYMERGVLSSRIAIDQAVKLLEKEEVMSEFVVEGQYFDQSNIHEADTSLSFAPAKFRPVFKVDAK